MDTKIYLEGKLILATLIEISLSLITASLKRILLCYIFVPYYGLNCVPQKDML